MPSSFYLRKWYMDAVDATGRAIIAYSGEIGWKNWRIPYSSLLRSEPGAAIDFKSGWLRNHWPTDDNDTLAWNDESLHVNARWERSCPPVRQTLFEHESGHVLWDCRFPAANARVRIGQHEILEGPGYAECLEITLLPWTLPMDTLRWGRFCAPDASLVWIEWQNETPRQWIFLNGQLIPGGACTINETDVLCPNPAIHLQIIPFRTLESEKKLQKIGSDLLSRIPGLNNWAPAHFLAADEYKWLSKGVLYTADGPGIEGWVIHERVDFSAKTPRQEYEKA